MVRVVRELSRARWVLHAVPLLVGWGIYWLAFFPGVVSSDVVSQWQQIQSRSYDDMQPAFDTFVIWLLTRPWHSLAAVSATHVALAAGLAGHVLAVARGRGAPRAVVWVIGSRLPSCEPASRRPSLHGC